MTEKTLSNKLDAAKPTRKEEANFTKSEIEQLGFEYLPPRGWLQLVKDRIAGLSDESDRRRLEKLLYKDSVRKEKARRKKIRSTRKRQKKRDNEHKDNFQKLNGFWNPNEAAKGKIVTLDDNKFYDSWQWTDLRFKTIKKYGAKCMLCSSTKNIQVDHIKPKSLYPDLALEPSNLQILCGPCNKGKSNKDITDFRPK